VVLNKPYGIAVQGGTGTKRHIDGLLAGMADRFGDRPRLVHRLDRDTTGVLLVAKHREAAARLGRVFQTRSAAKTYWALVKGVPRPPQGKVEAAPIPFGRRQPLDVSERLVQDPHGLRVGVCPHGLVGQARQVEDGLVGLVRPAVMMREPVVDLREPVGVDGLERPGDRAVEHPAAR